MAQLKAAADAASAALAAAQKDFDADKAKMTRALEELRKRAAKAQKAQHAAEMQVRIGVRDVVHDAVKVQVNYVIDCAVCILYSLTFELLHFC